MLRVVRGPGLTELRRTLEAQLAADIACGNGGQWLWLVPTGRWAEAISTRAMRASGVGAAVAPRVMSLEALAQRCGRTTVPPHVESHLVHLLIADVIERDAQAARSFVNGRGAARAGAVNQLAKAFERLTDLGEELPPVTGGIEGEAMRVLRQVQRRLVENKRISPGTRRRLQRQAVRPQRLKEEFIGIRTVVLDGFDDFDSLLRQAIGALRAWLGDQGDVILLVDDDPNRPGLCAHMREAMDEILADAEDAPFVSAPVETPLAAVFGGSQGESTALPPDRSVILQPCRTPHDEAVWIARAIKRFAIEQPEVPLSQIAVVFAQPSAVLPTLREVFRAWGIPHDCITKAGTVVRWMDLSRIDGGRTKEIPAQSLASSPLAQAALALWRLAAGDFQRRDLAALLRHRLWRGVYRFDSASVEIEARELRVAQGGKLWRERASEALQAAEAMNQRPPEDEDEDQDMGLVRERRLHRLRRLNHALERMASDLEPLHQRGTLGEALRALWDLLVKRRVVERLMRLASGSDPSAMTAILRSAAIFGRLLDEIDDVEWISSRPLPPDDALRLGSALMASTPIENSHPGTEAVQVFGQSQGRYQLGGRRWAMVFVGGLIEGAWPRVERASALGLPTSQIDAPEVDLARQRHALYQILRLDPERLILTWPVTSGDAPQNPSPLLEEVAERLGLEDWRRGAWKIEDVDTPASCLAPHELQWTAAAALEDVPEEDARHSLEAGGAVLEPVREGLRIARARRALEGWSQWEGRLADPTLIRLWAERNRRHIWSASELEALSRCAWRTLMERMLRLTPPPKSEAMIHRLERGTLIHAILCEGLRRWRAETGRSRAEIHRSEENRAAALMAEVAETMLDARPQGALMWDIERDLLLGTEGRAGLLRAFVEREAREGGKFAPRHLEWRFGWREGEHTPGGTEGDAPPLTLGESIRVRGVIDRIDCDEAEAQWEIIDYKTGSAKFNSTDVMEGRHLQLPLYALAVGEALASDQGQVVAASIHSVGRIRDLGVKRLYTLKGAVPNTKGKTSEEIDQILNAAHWHVNGIVERAGNGDFHWTTRPERDACQSCAWSRTCRRDEEKVTEIGPPLAFGKEGEEP